MSSTTMSRQPEQNKMGTMPVNRLLISMSLPMIISMLVQALYNIIDSVFVAQISEAALAAVSMAFPVQSLMIAVSTGTCVGVNALLSRSLGEGKQEEARLAAVNGIFLAILGALAFLLFGLFGAHTYFSSQIRLLLNTEHSIWKSVRYSPSESLEKSFWSESFSPPAEPSTTCIPRASVLLLTSFWIPL